MSKKNTIGIPWNKIKKGGSLPDFYKKVLIKNSETMFIGYLSDEYYDHKGAVQWVWVNTIENRPIESPIGWAEIPVSNE